MFGRHEVRIGTVQQSGCWVVVRKNCDFLSESSIDFLVHLDEFEIEAKIAKDTPEGQRITKFLKSANRDHDGKLRVLCLSLLGPRISPHQWAKIARAKFENGLKEGRNQMRKQFVNLLEEE